MLKTELQSSTGLEAIQDPILNSGHEDDLEQRLGFRGGRFTSWQ